MIGGERAAEGLLLHVVVQEFCFVSVSCFAWGWGFELRRAAGGGGTGKKFPNFVAGVPLYHAERLLDFFEPISRFHRFTGIRETDSLRVCASAESEPGRQGWQLDRIQFNARWEIGNGVLRTEFW
jgi:hypothetical protein